MSSITVLGLVAGAFTTLSFLPQLLKVWRSRSASDLSWSMLWVVNVGFLLWFIYGWCIRDLTLMLSNGVSLGLASLILACKIRYEWSPRPRSRRDGRRSYSVERANRSVRGLSTIRASRVQEITRPLTRSGSI